MHRASYGSGACRLSESRGIEEVAWARLAHAALDGELAREDYKSLLATLEADRARAADFARLAMLHDAVARELGGASAYQAVLQRERRRPLLQGAVALAATLGLCVGVAWLALQTTARASAADVVARLVSTTRVGDRTYFVRALDEVRPARGPRGERLDASGSEARAASSQPTIDGAILYIRSPGSYVLARLDQSGAEVVSGADGSRAWIVPSSGPVRTSRDPRRFSGALPGSQYGIVFVDPPADIGELAQYYELALFPAGGSEKLARIEGVRRSAAHGGPKRIEVWYDEPTALIRLIRLENLPQARGGPRTVEFELIDDSALADDFFLPRSHHDASRIVINED